MFALSLCRRPGRKIVAARQEPKPGEQRFCIGLRLTKSQWDCLSEGSIAKQAAQAACRAFWAMGPPRRTMTKVRIALRKGNGPDSSEAGSYLEAGSYYDQKLVIPLKTPIAGRSKLNSFARRRGRTVEMLKCNLLLDCQL